MHGTQLGVSPVLRTRLGARSVLRTHWTQEMQKRRRLSLDATPAHLTQGLFLLMCGVAGRTEAVLVRVGGERGTAATNLGWKGVSRGGLSREVARMYHGDWL